MLRVRADHRVSQPKRSSFQATFASAEHGLRTHSPIPISELRAFAVARAGRRATREPSRLSWLPSTSKKDNSMLWLLSPFSLPSRARTLRTSLGFALLAAATTSACVGSPLAPTQSQRDPANPNAPEAPSVSAAPSEPVSVEAPKPARAASDVGVTYTCPMHPEVHSDAPGKCPKCGMTLVPRHP
jgi:hypothetical protein